MKIKDVRGMKKIRRKGRKYVSLFTKSVVAFLLIGIIPLFAIGFAVNQAYANNIQNTLLNNLTQMTLYVGKNVTNIFDEMEQNTKYLYNYRTIPEYDYFYQMMQDPSITETKRSSIITNVLRNLVYRNQYIDHVLFLTRDGRVYSSMRSPETMLNATELHDWNRQNYCAGLKTAQIIPTHLTTYYFYSKTFDFSFSRNIMNTASIQTADHDVIGTLYIDINIKYLTDIINKANFGDKHEISIIDRKQKTFVYSKYDYNIGKDIEEFNTWLPRMTENNRYLKASGYYFVYSSIPNTDWLVVDKVPVSGIESSYKTIRNYTVFLLCVGGALLSAIYLYYSRKTNQPIQMLKKAMDRVQKGDLDIDLKIKSNDEIGLVVDGLNQMAGNLKTYINRVYLAEIKQKNAELERLRTQIQPHYLYNTLDVIRMMAITNDDQTTAQMLDSLSAQLKYLIGPSSDMVALNSEIQNIVNYFSLIRIRYDNRFSLDIQIPNDLLNVKVPRLILQPVVENAVKHGLLPKEGEGLIAIYAKNENGFFRITVMDNGIGMDEGQLKKLQALLGNSAPGYREGSVWKEIGVKNVNDRIRLIYGANYGLEISSIENMGTIVNVNLPFIPKGESENV